MKRERTIGRALVNVAALLAGFFAVHCDPRLDGFSSAELPREDALSAAAPPAAAPSSGTPGHGGPAATGSVASPGPSAEPPSPSPSLPPYAVRVLSDSPIGYWRFEEATGSVAHDASGHGNDGTYGATVVHGLRGLIGVGAAAQLDGVQTPGVEHFIRVAESKGLEPASAVTIEGWVQIEGPTTVNLISYGSDTDAPYEPWVLWLKDSVPNAYVVVGGSGVGVVASLPIAPGAPHHLVEVYDGGSLVLYVDGVSAASTVAHGTIGGYDAVNGLGIGSGYQATRSNLPGLIDEVAIYGVALTPTQVEAHYQAAQQRP